MRPGRRRSAWWSLWPPALALVLTAGCAGDGRLERALLSGRDSAAHVADRDEHYIVHCPDVVEVRTTGESMDCPVGADGRIALADGERLRADGLTAGEIARSAARRLGLPPEQVHVDVSGYNSEQIYLFGQVAGVQRAVTYQGPETVVDLLRRAGGVAPGAAPGDVQVLRSHVADGRSPELFHVDLQAILLKNDQRTNILLEPFDQVYVAQSRKSSLTDAFPPWLQPLYERVAGIGRKGRRAGRSAVGASGFRA